MSRRKIDSPNEKRKLSSKDFLELYDFIWKGTAPVKYQNPERWHEHVQRGEQ